LGNCKVFLAIRDKPRRLSAALEIVDQTGRAEVGSVALRSRSLDRDGDNGATRGPPPLLARLHPPHLPRVDHRHRTHMPRYPSPADTEAMVARIAPAILELLGDGVPRSRRAILAALVERHPKDEVARTLMRLAVTDRLAEVAGRYTLAPAEEEGGV
jgi:hypothetical protein